MLAYPPRISSRGGVLPAEKNVGRTAWSIWERRPLRSREVPATEAMGLGEPQGSSNGQTPGLI